MHARPLSSLFRAVLLTLTIACATGPASGTAVQVWTAPSSEKIRPDAAPRAGLAVQIRAARNEGEAFQVVISGAATGVRASATELTGPGGARIAAPRLHKVALINLPVASSLDGGTGRWPDALVPDVDEVVGERRNAFPFAVPAGESRAIWAQVQVPPGVVAGDYAGTVSVTWDGGSVVVPVTLTVWDFELPATASLKSAFGFAYGAIPDGHGLPWGDELTRLRQRYGAFALGRRVTLSQIDDGNLSTSHFDTWYSGQMDGTATTALAGAALTSVRLTGSADTWVPYFDARGWLGRLFQYTCDEPPITCAWSDIPTRAAAAKAVNPALRTLVTTTVQQADAFGVTSSIDILAPVVNYLEDRPGWSEFSGPQRARYDAFLASGPGKELWTYQSCMSHGCGGTVNFAAPTTANEYFVGWPTYAIDSAAVRNRAMEWISFLHGVTGELYYETAEAYAHDPWTNQRDFNGNGDGTLFYPGTPARIGGSTHIPISSIRFEMVREGMEDYEYLKRVSDLGDPAFARQVASELFPAPWATEVPPAAVEAARERLARRILELSGAAMPVVAAPAPATSDPATLEPAPVATGTVASPEPAPAGTATPTPDPVPTSAPAPVSDPAPAGTVAPTPVPASAPAPASDPAPAGSATPTPDASPAGTSSPASDPAPVAAAPVAAAATGGGCSAGPGGAGALLGLAAVLRRRRRAARSSCSPLV